jgi:hypothetical protein
VLIVVFSFILIPFGLQAIGGWDQLAVKVPPEMFNLLGKVGTTYSQTDVSANPASGGMATGSNNGFDWSYGIGAELVFAPQLSGVLRYDEHFMKFAGSSSERVSTTMIGARLRF